MSKMILGGVEYPLPPFTLGEVQKLVPALAASNIETVPGMAALATAVHIGVTKSAPNMTFAEVQNLCGVTLDEMLVARKIIGQMIGYYAKEHAPPGEDLGAASPSPS